MFKIIAYISIVFFCALCGLLKSMSYSGRLEGLCHIKDSLALLEGEMRYRREPLPEALYRVSQYKPNTASEFFLRVRDLLYENRACSMQECWNLAVEQCYSKRGFKDEDLAVIRDIGIEIGKSDIEGQSNLFFRVQRQMEDLCAQAQHEKDTKGKMYKSMGLAIGAVIVIILL